MRVQHHGAREAEQLDSPIDDEDVEEGMKNFASSHADMATKGLNVDVTLSRRLLECVQTTTVLGWYNVSRRHPLAIAFSFTDTDWTCVIVVYELEVD